MMQILNCNVLLFIGRTAWVDISNINAKVPIINNAVYMKLLILPDDVKPKQVK